MKRIFRLAILVSLGTPACAEPGRVDADTPASDPQDVAVAPDVASGPSVGAAIECAATGVPGVFTESRAALGIDFVHAGVATDDTELQARGGGVSVSDFDGDGFLDIYFVQGAGPDRVYLTGGRGALQFEGTPVEKPATMAHVAALGADADADGDIDVLLTSSLHELHLGINDGHGNFTVSATILSQATVGVEHDAAWGDINGDGAIDIITAGGPDRNALKGPFPGGEQRLLLGRGGLIWEEAPFPSASPHGRSFVAAPVDVDNDRDLDIYVVNDFGAILHENELYLNDGTGAFSDVSFESDADVAVAGMGLAVGDIDNDGWLDLYSTSMSPGDEALLRNLGGARFEDVTFPWSASTLDVAPGVAWGAVFIDLDSDGDEDLFVAHGYHHGLANGKFATSNEKVQQNVALMNTGSAFADVSASSGLGGSASSRSPVEADLDGDGFPDLVVGNIDGPPFVYMNGCSPDAAWIGVRVGGPSARSLGARIEVEAGGRLHVRELGSGNEGLSGSGPAEVTIGLGHATVVDTLRVVRIGGDAVELTKVPVRRWVTFP